MEAGSSTKSTDDIDVIEIDQRSLLEVFDTKHRYGKNLRYYYKEWQNINKQNESDLKAFFSWLDSPECPDVCLFFIFVVNFLFMNYSLIFVQEKILKKI